MLDKVFIDGLSFAAPLLIMAIGAIYSEKSGVTNLAVEGFQGFAFLIGLGCGREIVAGIPSYEPAIADAPVHVRGIGLVGHFCQAGVDHAVEEADDEILFLLAYVLRSKYVSLCEIRDMDVIADACPIWRIVVSSEYPYLLPQARGAFHDNGKKICRIAFQSQHPSFCIIAGGIEVS